MVVEERPRPLAAVRAWSTENERRLRLRELDGCLTELEDAHERGEVIVSVELAARVRQRLPSVGDGMSIAEALDRVFEEQALWLAHHGAWPDREQSWAPPAWQPPMDEAAARELTERIKSVARQTCMLLLEAHQRRAWSVLGYQTWERYVRGEFGLSRRRSYELLDQARVISAIKQASGLPVVPDISAYAALQIKRHLSVVTRTIRARVDGLPMAAAADVVGQIVREARTWATEPAPSGGNLLALRAESGFEVRELFQAVQVLSQMPAAADTLAALTEPDAHRLATAERALEWLAEFVTHWKRGPAG
jgi:hypothetical protein